MVAEDKRTLELRLDRGNGRLNRINRLISLYENFNREEEMEAHSKVYRFAIYSLELAAWAVIVSLPILLGFTFIFAGGLARDVLHVVRPSFPASKPPTSAFLWACRIYGGLLGIVISVCMILLDKAVIAAKSLSFDYRNKMLTSWKKTRIKLEIKLGKSVTNDEPKAISTTV